MPAVCATDAIEEGRAYGFEFNGSRYIVTRENNCLYAYRNRCPHIGVPLEWQPNEFIDQETGLLRCATHGALFLPDSGECVSGPCVGQSLQSVPFKVEQGMIWLID